MVKRRAGYTTEIVWNAETVKSLREFMGLTQQQFADELGVRQQTVSEWEVGKYTPRRSMAKYLSLVAERAGFEHKTRP